MPESIDDPGLKTAFEEANIQTWSQDEIEAYNYAGIRETEDRLRIEKAKKDRDLEIARQRKNKGMDR